VRLQEGDVPTPAGAGVSKSAASRHFVALSTERMKTWMATDLSGLDLLMVQIEGIHITEHLVLVAAVAIDGEGIKHPLGLMEGATENAAVVQALIDNLVARELDPTRPRLFIIDGSKALCKAIRRTFGRHTPIQRCQIHEARNIIGRLAPALHASVRRLLRQAWEMDDAEQAEKLIRNLARRLERDAPGVSQTLPEGLDEILTVIRLGLPTELRRSLACTNIYREHDGDDAPCQSQREALALGLDGLALDGSRHAGSQKRLSQAESLQTTPEAPRCTRCPPCKGIKQRE
jgi:putative transposase